jgi:hypothetical protein
MTEPVCCDADLEIRVVKFALSDKSASISAPLAATHAATPARMRPEPKQGLRQLALEGEPTWSWLSLQASIAR